MYIIIPLIDSVRTICIYRDAAGRLTIPSISYNMVETTVIVVAQYLAGLGWDWNDLTYLGPLGMGLPDGYFQITHDGAVGSAPAGYQVVWMSVPQIRDALNAKQFQNPVFADRAVPSTLVQTVFRSSIPRIRAPSSLIRGVTWNTVRPYPDLIKRQKLKVTILR